MAQALAQSAATATAIPSVRTSKLQRPAARTARVVAPRTISNAKQHSQMQVWSPFGNRFFETFSYLPPLSDNEISKQVDYIVGSGWVPTLEFQEKDQAYAGTEFSRLSQPGHYSNRYWTMWKLPMFGCTDPSQVLTEIRNCTRAFPDSYIRLVAFDSVRQVQITGFLVHRPPGTSDYLAPDKRSLA